MRLVFVLRMLLVRLGVWQVSMVSAIKMAEGQSAVDSLATEFSTYSDFLDSQITPTDLYYLEVFENNPLCCLVSLHHVLQHARVA